MITDNYFLAVFTRGVFVPPVPAAISGLLTTAVLTVPVEVVDLGGVATDFGWERSTAEEKTEERTNHSLGGLGGGGRVFLRGRHERPARRLAA